MLEHWGLWTHSHMHQGAGQDPSWEKGALLGAQSRRVGLCTSEKVVRSSRTSPKVADPWG